LGLKHNAAAGWGLHSCDAVETGGLARPVGADQADDLAGPDVEADIFQGLQSAEILAQVVYLIWLAWLSPF
jgi:hypothetical protein